MSASDIPSLAPPGVRGAISIRLRERLDLGSVPTEQLEALGALLALPADAVDADLVEVDAGPRGAAPRDPRVLCRGRLRPEFP